MAKIITHGGQAHRDEFLACCILLGKEPNLIIERRNPSNEELNSLDIYVLDVGMRYDKERKNFDHHQMGRDAEPTCALSLVLDSIGLLDSARDIFEWFYFTEIMDSKGPYQAARWLGIQREKLIHVISPIESQLLFMFGNVSRLECGDPLHQIMCGIGSNILSYLDKVIQRIELLKQNSKLINVKGLVVLDASFIDRDDDPALAMEIYCRRHLNDMVAVTIIQDDRGEGLSLFRRNDNPSIDFYRLNSRSEVEFAHVNGFIAKLKKDVDPSPLIEQAIL